MADKLDWMNKHLVLLRYVSLKDVIEKEGYKIRPDLEEFFAGVNGAEEMAFKFASAGDYKSACEFFPYIAHRRAAVWWGYRCVLSLLEELQKNPAVERDIADIGASLEPVVPDWAKIELPKPDPSIDATINEATAQANAEFKALEARLDPEVHAFVTEAIEVAFQEFKRVHGIHPIDLLKKAGEFLNADAYAIDPNSPAIVEAAKIKAQIAQMQKETVETIKSVIPPKIPAHQKKLRDNAMNAVYRWVAAPDAENSQKCMDVGNECPDTPAGLLSLSAFWAYGDLMPLGEQTVSTPPGLAANGLCQVLLLCALHPGGRRKLKERYAEYFRLGVEVLTGADNWEGSLVAGKAPHQEETLTVQPQATVPQPAAPQESAPVPPAAPETPNDAPVYKRWKPGDTT